MIDNATAYFEVAAERKRLKNKIRRELEETQATLAKNILTKENDFGYILINQLLREKSTKLENSTIVALNTIQKLMNERFEKDKILIDTENHNNNPIDEDWLTDFEIFAQSASSERLQEILGLILSKKILRPNIISRSTLRFMYELDLETANLCQLFAGHIVKNEWAYKSAEFNEGDKYLMAFELQHLGLLEGLTTGGPSNIFTIAENGKCLFGGRQHGLIIHGNPGTRFHFHVFLLTKLGRDVFNLFPEANEIDLIRNIAINIDKTGFKRIDMVYLSIMNDGSVFNGRVIEEVWSKPVD